MKRDGLVLIVDDSVDSAEKFRDMLKSAFTVEIVRTAASALDRIRSGTKVAAVLLDLKLPNGVGLNLVRRFQALLPDLPMVVIASSDVAPEEIIVAGAQDCVPSDTADAAAVFDAVAKAIVRHRVRKEFEPICRDVRNLRREIEEHSARLECLAASAR